MPVHPRGRFRHGLAKKIHPLNAKFRRFARFQNFRYEFLSCIFFSRELRKFRKMSFTITIKITISSWCAQPMIRAENNGNYNTLCSSFSGSLFKSITGRILFS